MKQVSTTQFTQASLTKKESKVNEVDSGMMIKECISDFLIEQPAVLASLNGFKLKKAQILSV